MKKIFFTISLMGVVLMPYVVMAQSLPEEVLDYLHSGTDGAGTYQTVILEEGFGKNSGLPKEFEDRQFYRVSECTVVESAWDTTKETGPVICNTLQNLALQCTPKEWSAKFPSGTPKPMIGDKKTICDPVSVVVGKGGLELLKNFISTIYVWGAGLVGLIAVLRIVIAGVEISASQGAGNLEEAKNKIFQCIASLILLFLSAMLLYTINPNFFT